MKKVVKIKSLKDKTSGKEDLAYWLSKTPEERIAAVEQLRKQYYGNYTQRLQRVIRVIQRKQN